MTAQRTGSIVIPAHNEARVIRRLLEALLVDTPDVEIVVACNGCSDDTAAVARAIADRLPLRVIDLPEPSKAKALNAAEADIKAMPRAFVDADIVVSGRSVKDVLEASRAAQGALIARPPLRYQTAAATPLVRAFYRARSRTPSLMTAMWGAGFYAVSETARARWETFPDDVADDFFVDALFQSHEKQIVPTEPVLITPPQTTRALLRTLRRVYSPGGHDQIAENDGFERRSSVRTLADVLRANAKSPQQWADAVVYIALALVARLSKARDRPASGWERDDTSRRPVDSLTEGC